MMHNAPVSLSQLAMISSWARAVHDLLPRSEMINIQALCQELQDESTAEDAKGDADQRWSPEPCAGLPRGDKTQRFM